VPPIDPTPPAAQHTGTPWFGGAVAPAWGSARAGRIRQAGTQLKLLLRDDHAAELSVPELALALLLRVDLDLAAGEVAAATAHVGRIGVLSGPLAETAAALASGETAAACGDHAVACTRFLAAGSLPEADEAAVRPWWVGAVLSLVRTGRRREGADLAREQVARAETTRDPYVLAHGLRALATADTGHDPIGTLQRARRLATLSGSQRLAVQLDTDIAAMTILSPGTPDPAILPLLRNAETYAGREGLWPLHTRVVSLLGRLGEQARPLAGRTLDVLTPAEARVAGRAARGLTNRQIAADLEVSVKGIEWHLSRIYRKLGIANREALVELLDEDSLRG